MWVMLVIAFFALGCLVVSASVISADVQDLKKRVEKLEEGQT